MDLRRLCLLAALAGCVDSEPVAALEQAAGNTCPSYGCGTNSPKIGVLDFYDLHEGGAENRKHFRIVGFEPWFGALNLYEPDVIGDELVARIGNTIIRRGTAMAGAKLTIHNTQTGEIHYLRVVRVLQMSTWTTPAATTFAYELVYDGANTTATNLCSEAGARSPRNEPMDAYTAVLFADDRIDDELFEVRGRDPGWFNIGCATHALAKLHLTGNTSAAAALLGMPPPPPARSTAHLKLFAADYCGIGEPFTVAGTPLEWNDALSLHTSISPGMAIEAFWDEHGAVCLNTPRLALHPQAPYPAPRDVLNAIGARCAPPPCSRSFWNPQFAINPAYAVSANP